MRRIVLDAGPLYALFSAKDTYHSQSKKGFQQLAKSKTALITPVSIVFEVYKLIAQRDSLRVARTVRKANAGDGC